MSDSDDSDESLDLTSPKFDPLKALYSKNVRLPNPDSPVLDNIHKYRSVVIEGHKAKPEKVPKDTESGPSTSQQPQRRFLPHQEPVRSTRPRKTLRNVLTRMKNITGPLSVLTDCMERRIRIKVYTRHMSGVRGYCIAFLAAFDKHWNMALEDVQEVWTRRRKRKVPALGEPHDVKRKVQQPRVIVIHKERKTEICERHVGQMLLRGEHVALISVLDR